LKKTTFKLAIFEAIRFEVIKFEVVSKVVSLGMLALFLSQPMAAAACMNKCSAVRANGEIVSSESDSTPPKMRCHSKFSSDSQTQSKTQPKKTSSQKQSETSVDPTPQNGELTDKMPRCRTGCLNTGVLSSILSFADQTDNRMISDHQYSAPVALLDWSVVSNTYFPLNSPHREFGSWEFLKISPYLKSQRLRI